jgi:hypothetical protein
MALADDILDETTRFVAKFATGLRCHLLDAVIDTCVGERGELEPFLGLWALNVVRGASLDAALRKARRHDDPGFIEDVLVEIRSDTPGFPLARLFPRWPDGLAGPEKKLARHLRTAPLPAGVKRFWLRYVDSLDITTLR